MKFFVKDIEIKGITDLDGIERNLTAPLRCYIPDLCGRTSYTGRRPAVVIFPGGGYSGTYSGEAEPIALKFAADGVCAFVLDYTCKPVRFPIPQLEAFFAIRYVRDHAEEFSINKNNIASLGFSAGGHLCACTGTLWDKPGMETYLGSERDLYRPDKLILCYPVIKAKTKFAHMGSIHNLLGENNLTEENITLVSLDEQIDDRTPPAFLWHTAEDFGVPIRNTLDFAAGLAERHIPTEIHVYLHGGHGSCLGNYITNNQPYSEPLDSQEWIVKASRFLFDESIL